MRVIYKFDVSDFVELERNEKLVQQAKENGRLSSVEEGLIVQALELVKKKLPEKVGRDYAPKGKYETLTVEFPDNLKNLGIPKTYMDITLSGHRICNKGRIDSEMSEIEAAIEMGAIMKIEKEEENDRWDY